MTGNCFEAAGVFLQDNQQEGMKLVHGEVRGQGPIDGIMHGHAWIELDGMVIDVSNGREVVMPKTLYYEIGCIADNIKHYSFSDLRRWVIETGHWGPWELQTETGL